MKIKLHMKHGSLLCGLVLCGLSLGHLAVAQPATNRSAQTGQLEEIVVTAQRVESRLQQTPIAVTAVSGETLAQRGSTTLLDLAAFTPNLTVGSRSGQGSTSGGFAIRGIGIDSINASASVGIYVDEVYYPSDTGNLLGLFDIDRIEVLRGPQGTLFGRNTIGGALQYISVKPAREFGGFVEATGGSNGRQDVAGALNLPLTENLAARLSGAATNSTGYVDDEFTGTSRGGDRVRQGRLQFRWTPGDRFTADVKAETLRERTDGRAVRILAANPVNNPIAGAAFFFGGPLPIPPVYNAVLRNDEYSIAGFNAPDRFELDYHQVQAILAYDLTESLTLKSISAFSNTEASVTQDIDGTPLAIVASALGPVDTDLFSQELQLSGRSLGERLRWTAGLYYYDSSRDEAGRQIRLGLLDFPAQPGNVTDSTSKAAYFQATYNLTPRVSATLGLRYTDEDNELAVQGGATRTASFTNTSPHVGLNFQATEDLMFYAKAVKGFRAGGQLSTPTVIGRPISPFGPETAWSYEAGARMEFLDRRVRINPTVFFTTWTDIQLNVIEPPGNTFDGTPVPYALNGGEAEIKGLEIETQFAATSNWLLTASISTLDGKYVSVSPEAAGLITTASDLQRAPELQFAIGSRYTHPLSSGASLVGSLDYGWVDDQRSAVSDLAYLPLPSYGLLNARLQYNTPGGRWSVAVFGTNLTDSYYYIGGIDYLRDQTVPVTEADLGRPREFGITLRANF